LVTPDILKTVMVKHAIVLNQIQKQPVMCYLWDENHNVHVSDLEKHLGAAPDPHPTVRVDVDTDPDVKSPER
jgi:hypothetical protein